MIAYQEAGAIVVLNDRGDVQSQTPRLALVMPYFRNPRMLQKHLSVWKHEWPDALKSEVEIVIVDDASPDETAAEVIENTDRTGLPTLSLYRKIIRQDWGQHSCRNIAAKEATAPWLLLTDMDHVLPPSTLREVLSLLPLGCREVITFGRVDAPAEPWEAEDWPEFARTRRPDGSLKAHVNSFCLARDHFWSLSGYDESFITIYGCDQEFRTRLWKHATERHLEHAPLIRVGREVIADASTRGLKRKSPAYKVAKKAVTAAKARRGEARVVKSLQFAWERVL